MGTSLTKKRRYRRVGPLAVMVGAAILVMGGGSAAHANSAPCSNEPYPIEDTYVFGGSQTYVGLDHTASSAYGIWACVAITGGEANDYNTGVGVHEGNPSSTGKYVEVITCDPGPGLSYCSYVLAPTGVEAGSVTVTPNAPGGTTPGTGVVAGGASGTCATVDGTVICHPGATIAAVTVNEGDLPTVTPTTTTSPPACTGINNECPGATVRVFNDTTSPTADVNLGITGLTVNVMSTPQCLQVNSVC